MKKLICAKDNYAGVWKCGRCGFEFEGKKKELLKAHEKFLSQPSPCGMGTNAQAIRISELLQAEVFRSV